jgi:hypothetical protein
MLKTSVKIINQSSSPLPSYATEAAGMDLMANLEN